uniref:Uncharacterized protein n=1 Tax=Euplotes harpa TaxID=151035 RepID=A0A7S3JFL3_9SPIT|mmetsp:Transcript_37859/g.43504  ORF Transcript_37859/g.43504 Transcript_37859/m.43504 type:complete len:111 (+) Transcript_37859:24-356(+)
MNRIRNKFFKPFLDHKRVSLRSSSMARRKAISSLQKVGEAYGVILHSNGCVSRRPPATADVKKRPVRYKLSNNQNEQHDTLGDKNILTASKPVIIDNEFNQKFFIAASSK